MGILRGLICLLVVIGIATGLLHQIVPHSVSSPRRVMETAINLQGVKARLANDTTADDELHREELDGGPHTAPSPLETMITAQGLPCRGVVSATPMPAGDGLFWIQCRTGSGIARYRVDTRNNLATAA